MPFAQLTELPWLLPMRAILRCCSVFLRDCSVLCRAVRGMLIAGWLAYLSFPAEIGREFLKRRPWSPILQYAIWRTAGEFLLRRGTVVRPLAARVGSLLRPAVDCIAAEGWHVHPG